MAMVPTSNNTNGGNNAQGGAVITHQQLLDTHSNAKIMLPPEVVV